MAPTPQEARGEAPTTKESFERSTKRPIPLAVCRDSIPDELQTLRQWVCWCYRWKVDKQRKGKWTKVPINPHTGKEASSTDPSTWGDIEDAYIRYTVFSAKPESEPRRLDGIGFVFAKDGPYCGVDLDDCIDTTTGTVREWGAEIVRLLDSYTEYSPSETGLKVFLKARKPGTACKKPYPRGKKVEHAGEVEIYDHGRFFCVTGRRLEVLP